MSLRRLGWTEERSRVFDADHPELVPGRVTSEHRGTWCVNLGDEERIARLPGRGWRGGRIERPAVGDWVGLRKKTGQIEALLERRSVFLRKAAGLSDREQVVAANLDKVFVMMGLDEDFNPRRLERYLAATWASGAQPVVLLNKSDLCEEVEARVAEAREIALDCPVVAISARDPAALEAIAPHVSGTICLVGSSGVGKSTLTNLILGEEVQEVREVRETDSKGRHTTTRRELFPTRGGALIDTPGMRELSLWRADEGLDRTFAEVLGQGSCRYRDCEHREEEDGCAVWAAVEAGTIRSDRALSYLKLRDELAEQARRRALAERKAGRGRRRR